VSKGYSDSRALEFAKCMRDHGVTNDPDPTYGKNGLPNIAGRSSYAIDAQSPAFQRAAKACQSRGIPVG
jgi:hypothetical protein